MVDIASLLGKANPGVTSLLVCIGILSLLFGYRLTKLFIFLIGFAIGTFVSDLFLDMPIAILVGLAVGAVCYALWYLGIFALGALLGLLIAAALDINNQVGVICIAILFGLLALAIRKFMIILSTSWFGACLVSNWIVGLMKLNDMAVSFGITILIAGIGVLCQYTVTSGKKTKVAPSSNDERSPDKQDGPTN